jgi:hypothetical protein
MRRLFLLIVVLCLSAPVAPVGAVDEQQVKQAIEQAKSAFDKALAEQGGWVSTSKLLKDAELNATKGEKQKALELASQAKREAELSYALSVKQKETWSEPAYLSK